nr:MAG: hypothetical protein J07AB56_01700 [Candidatus Nanosalinarum sp. J07AB56]
MIPILPGESLEPGHLRAASQLLEHAVQGYHNSEKLKQMADAQPPPRPPTEPLDKQEELHEYALMRFIALYESEDSLGLHIVDDAFTSVSVRCLTKKISSSRRI